MGWYKKCPECGEPMDVHREEYEAFCHSCMIVAGMPRAIYNDLKKAAAGHDGDEDSFINTIMEGYGVRDVARRAFRKAKASG